MISYKTVLGLSYRGWNSTDMADTRWDMKNHILEDSDAHGFYENDDDIPTDEVLKDFYACVVNDLGSDKEFLVEFEATLANNDIATYQFKEGSEFNPDYIFHKAPDDSNIIHLLIEKVIDKKLPAHLAGHLTKILVSRDSELIYDCKLPDPRARNRWRNPLEYASSFPECMDIVKAICEHGMVRQRPIAEYGRKDMAEATLNSEKPNWIINKFSLPSYLGGGKTSKSEVIVSETRKIDGTADNVPSRPESGAQGDAEPDGFQSNQVIGYVLF